MVTEAKQRTNQSFAVLSILTFLALLIIVGSFTGIFQQQIFGVEERGDFTYIFEGKDLSKTPVYSKPLTSGALSFDVEKPSKECLESDSCIIKASLNGKTFNFKTSEIVKMDDFISARINSISSGRLSSESICPEEKFSTSGVSQGCAVEETIVPGDLTHFIISFEMFVNVEDFIDLEYPNKQNVIQIKQPFSDEVLAINNYDKNLDGRYNINLQSESLFQRSTTQNIQEDALFSVGKANPVKFDIPTIQEGLAKGVSNPVILFRSGEDEYQAVSLKKSLKLWDVRYRPEGQELVTFDEKVDARAKEIAEKENALTLKALSQDIQTELPTSLEETTLKDRLGIALPIFAVIFGVIGLGLGIAFLIWIYRQFSD